MYSKYLILLLLIMQCHVVKKTAPEQEYSIARDYLFEESNLTQLKISSRHLFAVKSNNQLLKLDTTGTRQASYDAQQYGKIHTYSINKGLKHMLYYRDFEVIQWLDPFFAEIKTIQLKDWNLFDIEALNQSSENGIWLFDQNLRKLRKYDWNGNELFSSVDLYTVTDVNLQIKKLWEHRNYIYLLNSEGDLLQFDNLGNYLKTNHWNLQDEVVFHGPYVYFKKGNTITRKQLNFDIMQEAEVVTDVGEFESFDVQNQRIFLTDKKGVFTDQ